MMLLGQTGPREALRVSAKPVGEDAESEAGPASGETGPANGRTDVRFPAFSSGFLRRATEGNALRCRGLPPYECRALTS